MSIMEDIAFGMIAARIAQHVRAQGVTEATLRVAIAEGRPLMVEAVRSMLGPKEWAGVGAADRARILTEDPAAQRRQAERILDALAMQPGMRPVAIALHGAPAYTLREMEAVRAYLRSLG